MRGLRRSILQVKSDAAKILNTTLGEQSPNMEGFLKELVEEGLVKCIEHGDERYYAAVDGPSLYTIVQDRILGDLL